MENPWKYRFFTLLLVLLVLTNVTTLAFIWFRGGPHHGPPHGEGGPKHFLIKELKMTDKQQDAYEKLITIHRSKADLYQDSIRAAKDQLFNLMKQEPQNDSLKQVKAERIGELETSLGLWTFDHFKQVRGLLTAEQAKHFDEIINDALDRRGPPPPPPHDEH
jgi:Spy/CpxP family protein refolding chaperone